MISPQSQLRAADLNLSHDPVEFLCVAAGERQSALGSVPGGLAMPKPDLAIS